jgi:hypothetical protein
MSSLLRAASAALASGSLLLFAAAPALAQEETSATTSATTSDWRRQDRSESLSRAGSSQHFALGLRFGPYLPEVDDKPGLQTNSDGQKPYASVFGEDGKIKNQLYFGVEFDYLPLRIPYIGVVGPGIGWGYTHTSAVAKESADPTKLSATTTGFTIMPMHLSAVIRFDELMRRTGFPLVPYAKAGLGMGIWMASPVPDGYTGVGATFGLNFALGGALALNFLDMRSSARLDESTGVNHAYIFGEFVRNDLNGLGSTPTFYLGNTSWVAGFAIDM